MGKITYNKDQEEDKMSAKTEYAVKLHKNGCNCAQAVACTFCKEFGIVVMEMCGALSGMAMIIGLDNSKGNVEEGSPSKGDTYKKIKTYVQKFKEKNGSCVCRELKGVDTGKVLCSCPQCIADAVELTEEYLKSAK